MMEVLNTKTTLDEVIEAANDIQTKCRDEIFTVGDLHMEDDLTINGMMLSPLAQGELCGKMGIPGKYFSKLTANHMNELAADNMNTWFEGDTRKIMFREYDGHIRGVLSGSYSKYDAPEILNSIKDVFGDGHFKLKGGFINEERLHLRLVEEEMLPIDGEDLFAGLTLDSSDVGRSGLYVRFFIYKQVCTNGLIVAKSHANLFRQKHIGITSEEFKEGLEEGLATFIALKNEVVEMIENTRKIPLPDDIEELQKKIKEQTKLSDEDITVLFDLTALHYANTQWGLINGITEIAQKFTLDRRLALEEYAATMLA